MTEPHFCAAMVLEDETVIDAAPILKWSIGKRREWLRDYFRQKGWKAVVVTEPMQMSEVERALRDLIKAWETLPGPRHYSPDEIQQWLRGSMSPAINNARTILGISNQPMER